METSSVTMGISTIVVIILFLVNGILIPVIWALWRALGRNRDELEKHKLYVANNYMTKADTNLRFDKIDRNLDKIWKKLDESNIRGKS